MANNATSSPRQKSLAAAALKWIADEFTTLVILVSALSVAIANRFGMWTDFTGTALFAIFIALSIRVLQMRYQISGVSKIVEDKAVALESEFSAMRSLMTSNRLHEAEMCDRSGFYTHMLSAIREVRNCVDLTNLDTYPPSHYGTPAMVEYFQLQTRMVKERPEMRFRRIVAVPTLEKLEWLLDILDQVAACPNFQIGVIDTSDTGSTPPPLSLQIFDHKELCLVDPTLGYMLPEDQPHMLWVKGEQVGQVFSIYYDTLWKLAERVKEGNLVYKAVLLNLQKQLSVKYPEKRSLGRKLAVRINHIPG